MKKLLSFFAVTAVAASVAALRAATLTVTTANNPGAGSLFQALSSVQNGDVIRFNIAGAGPQSKISSAAIRTA